GFERGALGELVDDDIAVLAPPGDVGALAAALLRAATLDRRACRARAVTAFSSTAMIDAYEQWFGELVAA
ncbi:MAG: glycosyltransferase family 4 protein, partial [Ilumatobacteraceae bacterium]